MKKIKWSKWNNPITDLDINGSEIEEGRIVIKNTPFGLQPAKINNNNLIKNRTYIGHTNFDLDEDCKQILDQTPGVESVEIETSYMFRVVIGAAFNKKAVKISIEQALCQSDDMEISPDCKTKIYQEQERLRQQGKLWGIFILPNGNYESFVADSNKELSNKLHLYNSIRHRIGGQLIY